MRIRTLITPAAVIAAAILILLFVDASHAGFRFLAQLTILTVVLLTILSSLVASVFGAEANNKFLGTMILILISGTIASLAGEVAVRIVYSDVSTTNDNSSYFSRRWYKTHPPEINESGFREATYSRRKAPNTYRIAVIGDSFAYGQGIVTKQRFTNRLQEALNGSPGQYEVLNFGRPGAETDEHIQIFDDVVLDLSPDFVLLQWFVNDVEITGLGRPAPARLLPSSFAHSWLMANSAFYYVLNSRWASMQVTLGLTESYVDNIDRRFGNPKSGESVAAADMLEQLITRVKEQGFAFGIVLFPMMVDVQGDVEAYPAGFLLDRVLLTCDRHEIPCLDLRPVFASTSASPNLWASRFDQHPGPRAHELASNAILERFGPTWMSHRTFPRD